METAVDSERRLDSKLHRFDVTGNDADLLPCRERLRIRASRCLKNVRSRADPAQFKLAVRSYVIVRMDGIARLREQLHDRLLAGCDACNNSADSIRSGWHQREVDRHFIARFKHHS